MSNQNFKVVYSLKMHLFLLERGFKYKIEMKNPYKEGFNCWVYEATDEFLKVFDEYIRRTGA